MTISKQEGVSQQEFDWKKEEQSYKQDDKRSQEIRGILCGRITPKVSNSTSQL
jgi:hypothetical protein